MESKQVAAMRERTFSGKYSPKTRAAKDAANNDVIARRKAFEAEHLQELRAGDPEIRAQYYAIK